MYLLPSHSTMRKVLAIAIVLAVLFDTIQCRPRSRSKTDNYLRLSKKRSSNKFYSSKICGTLGDICKFGSRKHCCAAGFTCMRLKKKHHWKARHSKFGRCQPIPTFPAREIECGEEHSQVSVKEN